MVLDLEVIDQPDVAVAMLDPLRRQVLSSLVAPASASMLASVLGEPRQKVNYHLRSLEEHGLVELVEERPRRGLTERLMQASARSYVISPEVLGDMVARPERTDRLSTAYLVASASRTIREVAALARAATRAEKTLPTLTVDAEICFASARDRARFTEEMTNQIARLASDYHRPDAAKGRWHRVLVLAHPRPISPGTDTSKGSSSHDE